jgi:Ca2+-binding EF-hand superfamily protein
MMSTLKTFLLPALAAALLAASPALAKGHGDEGAMRDAMFTAADANADGSVTVEEMAAARKAAFTKADTNADGKLDAAEREAQMMARLQEMAKLRATQPDRMDANSDGSVTLEEFTAQDDRFAQLDTDANGAVSKAEFDAGPKGHGHGHGHDDGNGADDGQPAN